MRRRCEGLGLGSLGGRVLESLILVSNRSVVFAFRVHGGQVDVLFVDACIGNAYDRTTLLAARLWERIGRGLFEAALMHSGAGRPLSREIGHDG